MRGIAALVAAVLTATLALGCDSGDEPFDVQAILENEGGVLRATHRTLAARAESLQAAVDSLAAVPAVDSLASKRADAFGAAQAAWRSAHRPQEQRESIRFGPAPAASFDWWPADTTGIRALLRGSGTIGESRLAGLDPSAEGTYSGFHAIEFLLFGTGGNKTAEDVSEREIAYLRAATALLAGHAQALAEDWMEEASSFARAGQGNSAYVSPLAALDSLVRSMGAAAGAVGSEKIAPSLADTMRLRIESAYSANALVDLRNNLRGVRHLYTGDYDGRAGPGLDDIVRGTRVRLDEQIRQQTARAIRLLADLQQQGGGFPAAVREERETLRAARDAALDLRDTMQEDLASLIANLRSSRGR